MIAVVINIMLKSRLFFSCQQMMSEVKRRQEAEEERSSQGRRWDDNVATAMLVKEAN